MKYRVRFVRIYSFRSRGNGKGKRKKGRKEGRRSEIENIFYGWNKQLLYRHFFNITLSRVLSRFCDFLLFYFIFVLSKCLSLLKLCPLLPCRCSSKMDKIGKSFSCSPSGLGRLRYCLRSCLLFFRSNLNFFEQHAIENKLPRRYLSDRNL